MNRNVTATKSFMKEIKELKSVRPALLKKINDLDEYLILNGVDLKINKHFDVTSLWDDYFRAKFVPYRVIIQVKKEKKLIIFKKIFKRKWKHDYKSFS